ncbi:MAG TPA: AI-2E family transporter [Nocardioidaceae bacterium]|nr:AI-2E family transporter [Nocardioidaceae bacterium]
MSESERPPAKAAAAESARDEPEPEPAAGSVRSDDSARSDGSDAERDEDRPHFELPGAPFQRHSPFSIGFFGALGALLAITLVEAITATRGVLILIVVSFFIAVGLDPLVRRLTRAGMRRSIAVAIVALGLLAALAIFVVSLVPVITDQVQALIDNVPDWIQQARQNQTLLDLDERYDIFNRIESTLTSSDLANQVFGGALGVGFFVLSALFNAFVIFILTLYFLVSLPMIRSSFLELAPASRRDRVAYLTDSVIDQTGGYVIGAMGIAACAAVSTGIFLTIVGLGAYAIALALVVGLLDFIPLIGATIGAVIVSIIGFATGVGVGLACVIFFVIYQQIENYIVYPRIMSKSMSVPAVVTIVAALIGGSLLGVPGALLAIPVAAAVLFIMREVVVPRQSQH